MNLPAKDMQPRVKYQGHQASDNTFDREKAQNLSGEQDKEDCIAACPPAPTCEACAALERLYCSVPILFRLHKSVPKVEKQAPSVNM